MMDLPTASHLTMLSDWSSFASLFHVRTVLLKYKGLLIIITFVNSSISFITYQSMTALGTKSNVLTQWEVFRSAARQ